MQPTEDGRRRARPTSGLRVWAALAALALATASVVGQGHTGGGQPAPPTAAPGVEAGEGSPLTASPGGTRQPVGAGGFPGFAPPPNERRGAPAPGSEPAPTDRAGVSHPGDRAPRSAGPVTGPGTDEEVEVAGTSPEGFAVLAGAAAAGQGERRTFTVEIEDGYEPDADSLVETVHGALLDAESSWARDHELAQVEEPEGADIRIVLATPDTVDEWCGAVGLDTGGDSSCWDGQRAMLNGDRWRGGVDHIDDLGTYRAYLVNHEVGHGLGHGHVDCPEPGAPAPVMMQQTLGLGACEPNPWPYP